MLLEQRMTHRRHFDASKAIKLSVVCLWKEDSSAAQYIRVDEEWFTKRRYVKDFIAFLNLTEVAGSHFYTIQRSIPTFRNIFR